MIPVCLASKPRPRFLPNGRIVSNVDGYRKYKDYVAHLWKFFNGAVTIDQSYPLYIGLMSFWKPKRGGLGDLLDNKIGAVMDSLTEYKVITNDNARVLAGDKIMSSRAAIDLNIIVISYQHDFNAVDDYINNLWLGYQVTKTIPVELVTKANTLPSLEKFLETSKEKRKIARKNARAKAKAKLKA